MTNLVDDLKDLIARRQVVALIGAGVSMAATADPKPHPVSSWTGLLRHGVERCEDVVRPLPDGWGERVRAEIDSFDLEELLSAAEKISRRLGAPAGGEYRRWLRDTVGQLQPKERAVIEALQALGVPLATTNYDGLLEEVTGLEAVTWRDGARVERVLRGDETGVLHLHGYWRDPESVVLGIRSYEAVLGDAHAQTMLRVMRSVRSLLFVGFGAGLQDPNWKALLTWSGKVFRGSEYRQFRLALSGEAETLQQEHPPEERLFVLPYGAAYSDLAPFLSSLASEDRVPRGMPEERSPSESALFSPARLPALPRCFGRDEALRDLVSTLLEKRPPPTCVLGPPGIGKSTLCLAALHDEVVATRYGPRRLFVRCDAARDRATLTDTLLLSLGLSPGPHGEARLFAALEAAPTALVLDNAETPWLGERAEVETFLAVLAGVPGLALVAGIRGGQRPYGVAWRDAITLTPLAKVPATSVFLAVAGQRFATDPNLGVLVGAQDGLPLALELLAYQAEAEPDLVALERRWEAKHTELLQRGEGQDRLSNLAISLELSIGGSRMSTGAGRLLSVLARLPAGLAHSDLGEVFPETGDEAASTLRQVGLAQDIEDRLRLLAPVREYVAKTLAPSSEDLAVAAAFYGNLAREYGPRVGRPGGQEAVLQLTRELGNIEAMIGAVLAGSSPEQGIRYAIALTDYLRLSGEGSAMIIEQALAAAKELDNVQGVANCIQSLGQIALDRSDHEMARQHFEEAMSLYEEVGDVQGQANSIKSLGNIALRRSDHDTARQRFEEAMSLYEEVGDVLGQANCIRSLGEIALRRSDHEVARQRFEEALPLFEQVGSVLGQANCILSLGTIALERSDHDTARQRYEQALAMFTSISEPYSIGITHRRLAQIAEGDARCKHVSLARQAWLSIGRPDLVNRLEDEFPDCVEE